jgi:hypothetical protein
MLGETECAPLLRNMHCSRSARPIEDILERMMMDRTEMRKIQIALGKRFARPCIGNLGFEIVELALIVQIKLVNEDRRIFVGIRIIGRIIHATNSGFAIGANDHLAIFFSGQALAGGFCGTFFHSRLQSNTFYRANLREAGTADDEACFAAFSGRSLLLWHVRNLSRFLLFAMPSRLSLAADNHACKCGRDAGPGFRRQPHFCRSLFIAFPYLMPPSQPDSLCGRSTPIEITGKQS